MSELGIGRIGVVKSLDGTTIDQGFEDGSPREEEPVPEIDKAKLSDLVSWVHSFVSEMHAHRHVVRPGTMENIQSTVDSLSRAELVIFLNISSQEKFEKDRVFYYALLHRMRKDGLIGEDISEL